MKAERDASSGKNGEEQKELTPEELEALQKEKEKKAREYVEEMQKRNEIEGADPYEEEAANGEGGEDEEEEEDLIEL